LLLVEPRYALTEDKELNETDVPPSFPSARAWVGREAGEEGEEGKAEVKGKKLARKPCQPP